MYKKETNWIGEIEKAKSEHNAHLEQFNKRRIYDERIGESNLL